MWPEEIAAPVVPGGLWGGEETGEEGVEGGGGGEEEEDTRLVNNHGSLSRCLWRPPAR